MSTQEQLNDRPLSDAETATLAINGLSLHLSPVEPEPSVPDLTDCLPSQRLSLVPDAEWDRIRGPIIKPVPGGMPAIDPVDSI